MITQYEFVCPECDFNHNEGTRLAEEHEIYCPVCAEDGGCEIELIRWHPTTDKPYRHGND